MSTPRVGRCGRKQTVRCFLSEELARTIQVFAHKVKKARVTLRVEHSEPLQLYGNPVKFNQLVLNLIANAIDAYETVEKSRKREIGIRLYRKDDAVCLTVQDWGSGIAAAHLGHIFEPYFTTKTAEKGTGIGLFVCKNVTEQEFGGRIEVTSTEGVGTTFTVTLPLARVPGSAGPEAEPAVVVATPTTAARPERQT